MQTRAAHRPKEEDVIVYKNKARPFLHATRCLASLRRYRHTGCLGDHDGCVRASVTDAFALNFRVTVIEMAAAI